SGTAGLGKAVLHPTESGFSTSDFENATHDPGEVDVTQRTALLFRSHSFDSKSGILNECFALANRGSDSVLLPINLQAVEVGSPNPSIEITAVNSTNRLSGTGAVWSIADAIAGDRIPRDSATYPFCLSF